MAVYVMSDLHGNYDVFMSVLKKINLTFDDYLFENGDVVDRGVDGIKILQYMMMQPNIYPIMGNHEYALMKVLDFVSQELTKESIKTASVEDMQNVFEYQNIGGQVTLSAFHRLTREEQQDIME